MRVLLSHRRPIRHQFGKRFWITLLLLSSIVYMIELHPVVRRATSAALDTVANRDTISQTETTSPVVIVSITDATLRQYFGKDRPYRRPEILFKAIERILQHQPSAVGIDLLTDNDNYRRLPPPSDG